MLALEADILLVVSEAMSISVWSDTSLLPQADTSSYGSYSTQRSFVAERVSQSLRHPYGRFTLSAAVSALTGYRFVATTTNQGENATTVDSSAAAKLHHETKASCWLRAERKASPLACKPDPTDKCLQSTELRSQGCSFPRTPMAEHRIFDQPRSF